MHPDLFKAKWKRSVDLSTIQTVLADGEETDFSAIIVKTKLTVLNRTLAVFK